MSEISGKNNFFAVAAAVSYIVVVNAVTFIDAGGVDVVIFTIVAIVDVNAVAFY